nr:hypothetical protein [Tanacetum cinerariifolium]
FGVVNSTFSFLTPTTFEDSAPRFKLAAFQRPRVARSPVCRSAAARAPQVSGHLLQQPRRVFQGASSHAAAPRQAQEKDAYPAASQAQARTGRGA